MKNSLKTINEVQNHFGLEIGESYDAFCNLCFADEKEKKHFNLNLAVCLYDQRFLVEVYKKRSVCSKTRSCD
jgi:hypothetical protein